jgi:hypothetical protein
MWGTCKGVAKWTDHYVSIGPTCFRDQSSAWCPSWEASYKYVGLFVGWAFLFVCFLVFFETESHFIPQASLKLKRIFLLQSPKDWDYRCAPPHPAQIYI